MRPGCIDCTVKHLGSAAALINEVYGGYPWYYGYVIGELEQASQEIMSVNLVLARVIREHRLNWLTAFDSDEGRYDIPFEDLFKYLSELKSVPELTIPDGVKRGLEVNSIGEIKFSTDTR